MRWDLRLFLMKPREDTHAFFPRAAQRSAHGAFLLPGHKSLPASSREPLEEIEMKACRLILKKRGDVSLADSPVQQVPSEAPPHGLSSRAARFPHHPCPCFKKPFLTRPAGSFPDAIIHSTRATRAAAGDVSDLLHSRELRKWPLFHSVPQRGVRQTQL